ncbi:hypothetical protein EYF80_011816 [Liparis tanakae]|uniref:Uncharacterized protein n=1 Tax=Liparis tanakae TaxID=230148 RepID=A0A4Z2ILI6_9TELE|nr:hypothetical protein EYF80_011816 [Liparis tanakae]
MRAGGEREGGERQRQQKKQRGLETETVSDASGWNNVPRESQCEMPMKQKYRGCRSDDEELRNT